MSWRPFVALMAVLALLCMAGPHAHADTPRPAGASACDTGTHPHEHEASCDAPAAQPPAVDAPAPGQQGRAAACPLAAATPPQAQPSVRPAALLALLCVSRM
ncbi:hypothetical protein ACIBEJ_03685 [Nonomuraea sp. NPDC050790]|uniref:hypothetical protein n=1 Tax=Nonomuraea sp. NPDC050790 TaxID=3364371 RepID=UPI0037ADF618